MFVFLCVTFNNRAHISDYQLLNQSVVQSEQVLNNLKEIEVPAAYISRILFVLGPQLRRMNLFKSLKQLNQALLRIKVLNITGKLRDFIPLISITSAEKVAKLPAHENIEKILINLQTFSVLLTRVIQQARKATHNAVNLIDIGNFFAKNAIMLSVVSELYNLANICLASTYSCYRQIIQLPPMRFSKQTQEKIENKLPASLKDWLFMNGFVQDKLPATSSKESAPKTIDEVIEDVDSCEISSLTEAQPFGSDFISLVSSKQNDQVEDVGESVNRDESSCLQNYIQDINSSSDIVRFIQREDKLRHRKDLLRTPLAAISHRDWKLFKESIKKMMNSKDAKQLVKTFKSKLKILIAQTS